MERIHRWYDNFAARHFTLNGAILYILFYALMCFNGAFDLRSAVQKDDPINLFLVGLIFLLGFIGMVHGAQVIHAVVRRLVAEARGTERPSASPADTTALVKEL